MMLRCGGCPYNQTYIISFVTIYWMWRYTEITHIVEQIVELYGVLVF